jgi:SAM-dependent methyltransferase
MNLKSCDLETLDGFDPDLFSALYDLEPRNFWFKIRNRVIVDALQTYFPAMMRFLEIGCGTGFVLSAIQRAFPVASITGGDYYPQALTFCRRRVHKAELFEIDARHLPFENHFDVIGLFDVIEHIDYDEGVLQQLYRACRPGGGILLTVPQHPFLWSRFDEQSFHQRRYTRGELIGKVESTGFRVLRVTSLFSILLPIALVSRLANKKSSQDFDLLTEFRIHPIINRLLELALYSEKMFINAGVSLPFGSSLLVVAQR